MTSLYIGQESGWMPALKRADRAHTCGAFVSRGKGATRNSGRS